jgi:hypothetical protein
VHLFQNRIISLPEEEIITMFTVKKCVHLCIALLLLTALFSFNKLWAAEKAGQSTAASKQDQPHLSLDAPQFDAGEVDEGAVIVHGFTVKNTGTAPLNIEKVKAG